MPDLSQFGTAASPAPPSPGPAPQPGGGGLSQFGSRDLSAFGTPAAAAQPSDSSSFIDTDNSAPGDVHFRNPVIESLSQLIQGVGSSALEVPATIGNTLHRYGGSIIGASDPITDALTKAADMKRDSLSSKAGALFETMAEWIVGEGELKALTQSERMAKLAPVVKVLEKFPKLTEGIVAHPAIASTLRQAALGTAQAAAHGEDTTHSLEAGATAGVLGGVTEAALAGGSKLLRGLQSDVAPRTLDLGGVPITELASEQRGPNGEILASKRAQNAAQYPSEYGLQAERQAGFKQMQTNLAKQGLEGALNDANAAASSSGVAPAIQRTTDGWRYIPKDGSTSLTADETRQAMNELKDHWLDNDWTPSQEAQIKDTYNDMQQQLERHDTLNSKPLPPGVQGPEAPRLEPGAEGPKGPDSGYQVGTAPVEPFNVAGRVANTDNWADAASHLRGVAREQLRDVPGDVRQQYLALDRERAVLQDDFRNLQNDPSPNKRGIMLDKLDEINSRMESLLEKGATDSPQMMAQPFKSIRLANAFDKMHNVMEQHFNINADTAQRLTDADMTVPRVATKLKSLSSDIEKVRSQYGDVLNPVIGDDGLDHIIKLGKMLDQPRAAHPAAQSVLQQIQSTLKQHYAGGRGVIGGGAGVWMLHQMGVLAGGAKAGVGILAGHSLYKTMIRRMATDPAFAETILKGMQESVPLQGASKAASAALATQPLREEKGQGLTDADSE